MKSTITQAFTEHFQQSPEIIVRAPGRVNLLGAHTDYNDGYVFPCAIDRAVWLAAAPNNSNHVTIHYLDFNDHDTFSLQDLTPQATFQNPKSRYPAGVAWVLQEAGHQPTGLNVAITSNVPIGAGVSSSAAIEMAFVLAWEALSGLTISKLDKARLGQRTENDFLGVQSGIMDQFASIHGAQDHLIFLDCRSLDYELIPLPAGTTILVADSGIRRQLAHSNYNLRPQQCRQAVATLKPHLPHIQALRDISPADFALHAHRLPLEIRRRAQHVVEECQRVLDGAQALQNGDIATLGHAIRRSHQGSRDLYEISLPELDLLAATAWQTPGCYGARLTGAGFGGCVAVLADQAAIPTLTTTLTTAYQQEFNRTPAIFTTQVANGASLE